MKNKISYYIKNHPNVVLFSLFLMAIVIAVIIWINHMLNKCPVDNAGAYGDTINGLFGPIVGLLSAILIFISFRAQTRANELLSSEHKRDSLLNRINLFSEDIPNNQNYLFDLNHNLTQNNRFTQEATIYRLLREFNRLNSIQLEVTHLAKDKNRYILDFYIKHCETFVRQIEDYVESAIAVDVDKLEISKSMKFTFHNLKEYGKRCVDLNHHIVELSLTQ